MVHVYVMTLTATQDPATYHMDPATPYCRVVPKKLTDKQREDLAAIRKAEAEGTSIVAAMYERMSPAERGAYLRAHQPKHN